MATPFRLARVQWLVEQMRRMKTHEAERIAAELVAARAEVARLRAERERLGDIEAADARAGRLTPDGLRVGRTYDGALATAERAKMAAVAELERALEVKRAEVLRARQEEEKYARLEAAHRLRVLEEEAREVDRALDEIAVDRHRRNRKEQVHDDA